MAERGKRPHILSIVGTVIILAWAVYLAAGHPAGSGALCVVGMVLLCAGRAAARKAESR
jgi:hypothetical protein